MKYILILAVLWAPIAFADPIVECKLTAAYADTLRRQAIVDRLVLVPGFEQKAYLEQARAQAKAQYEAEKAKCK